MIKFYFSRQSIHLNLNKTNQVNLPSKQYQAPTHHLHEVDEAVAVLPGVLAVTAQRTDVDVLREIQLVESLGEQLNCVVDKSSLGLDKKFVFKTNIMSSSITAHLYSGVIDF